jgi:hypothetical protein
MWRGGRLANSRTNTVVNLGGEGEIPRVLNQQRAAVLSGNWASCHRGETLQQLGHAKHNFLICDNASLAIQDSSVRAVITNNVPLDKDVLGEAGISTREIERILIAGGRWIHNSRVVFTKP